MSEMTNPSAVTAPDTEPKRPPSPPRKRRQSESSEEENENKKRLVSASGDSPVTRRGSLDKCPVEPKTKTGQPPPDGPRVTRRGSTIADEKQRSKRLFGALLGNMSRPNNDRATKRRQEIEERKRAEAQRQDDERAEDKQRRLERLAERRKREEKYFEEEKMRIRHSNLLNTANFLLTTAEPRLFYRPWDLLPDEEDQIDEQVRDVQAVISREAEAFEKSNRENEHDQPLPIQNDPPIEAPQAEEVTACSKPEIPPDGPTASAPSPESKKSEDDQGQVKSDADIQIQPTDHADLPLPGSIVTDTFPIQESSTSLVQVADDVENSKHDEIDASVVVEGEEDEVIY